MFYFILRGRCPSRDPNWAVKSYEYGDWTFSASPLKLAKSYRLCFGDMRWWQLQIYEKSKTGGDYQLICDIDDCTESFNHNGDFLEDDPILDELLNYCVKLGIVEALEVEEIVTKIMEQVTDDNFLDDGEGEGDHDIHSIHCDCRDCYRPYDRLSNNVITRDVKMFADCH